VNPLKHSALIPKYVSVPEPQHCEAGTRQPPIPQPVACPSGVLVTVQLDNQATFETTEVDDIPPQRLLPTELGTRELERPKKTPQDSLDIRLSPTKHAGQWH
jgi:hypothetical protein